jgi:hypothetical protein
LLCKIPPSIVSMEFIRGFFDRVGGPTLPGPKCIFSAFVRNRP